MERTFLIIEKKIDYLHVEVLELKLAKQVDRYFLSSLTPGDSELCLIVVPVPFE